MSEIQYTTVNRILGKFHRDLKGTNVNESDAIEWIGEALEFAKVKNTQKECVFFAEVVDYHVELPTGFQMVLQIAKDNRWSKEECLVTCDVAEDEVEVIADTQDCPPEVEECSATYEPYKIEDWTYTLWNGSDSFQSHYTPVRLANNSFFNSIVAREKDQTPYKNCRDEYTIVGTTDKFLRFSFREGYVAISYLSTLLDVKTGYPLIPDNISYITAITYYMKWKIAEWYSWNGREGYKSIAQESERLWLKYVKQGKNFMKMPKSLDDYQDLLEQSHQMIPNHYRYYSYFGKMSKPNIYDVGRVNEVTVIKGKDTTQIIESPSSVENQEW